MGIMSKILGGSDDSEEESGQEEQNLEQAEDTLEKEPREEKEPVETIEFGDDGQYSLPEDKLTEVDETLQEVEDPAAFLAGKSAEGRQAAYDKSFIAEAFRREATEEVRKGRGAHQTARTTALWAKDPNADGLIEAVAEDSGMEADEIYEDMSSDEKEEMIRELVSDEVYSAADNFAVASDSFEELQEAISSEIGEEIKEKHEDEDYTTGSSLDRDTFNTVNALMMSLSRESYGEFDESEALGLDNFRKGKKLDNESKARYAATAGSGRGNAAQRAVEERWNNEEYEQAALLAETFDVESAEVESNRTYEDEETIEDIASEAVEKFRRQGDYEEAVELAGDAPGGVGRDDLLEDLARRTDDEEEAYQVATAGYTEGEIMDQAIEYVDNQVKEGNTEAYEDLNEAAGYDIAEDLSPEAQTDLKLADL
jgi:hypothetical protein